MKNEEIFNRNSTITLIPIRFSGVEQPNLNHSGGNADIATT
jgi:hypothetical protein